jgi:hypothetical protein
VAASAGRPVPGPQPTSRTPCRARAEQDAHLLLVSMARDPGRDVIEVGDPAGPGNVAG